MRGDTPASARMTCISAPKVWSILDATLASLTVAICTGNCEETVLEISVSARAVRRAFGAEDRGCVTKDLMDDVTIILMMIDN